MYTYDRKELKEDYGMPAHAIKAFLALQSAGCPVKTWDHGDRGHFWIDAEEPEASDWLEYWSMELMSGSKKLNKILNDNNLYFEWANPGYASVYNIN
jgi:hypothetical protein